METLYHYIRDKRNQPIGVIAGVVNIPEKPKGRRPKDYIEKVATINLGIARCHASLDVFKADKGKKMATDRAVQQRKKAISTGLAKTIEVPFSISPRALFVCVAKMMATYDYQPY